MRGRVCPRCGGFARQEPGGLRCLMCGCTALFVWIRPIGHPHPRSGYDRHNRVRQVALDRAFMNSGRAPKAVFDRPRDLGSQGAVAGARHAPESTKLDRLARSVHHLLIVARELEALVVGLVVTEQALDTTTPAGRLLFHVLAAISEFERDLIRDRVLAGLRRTRAQRRRLGRPTIHKVDATRARELLVSELSLRATARALAVPHVAVSRALANSNGWHKSPSESAR